jgi:processive 1,2-diacylglycerol beta-glucosyltransferase
MITLEKSRYADIIKTVKVLILAVPIGAGHLKAGGAIKQALAIADPGGQVRLENCFKWVFPPYGYCYRHIFEFGQKHSHRLLKLLYGGVGVKRGDDRLLYLFHRKSAYRFRKLLIEYRPDYILAVHFSPAYYSAVYKREFGYRLGVVVTDYFVHPHWVNREVDHYFIPHENLLPQIVSYGAAPEKALAFGIPIATEIAGIDRGSGRKRFNIAVNRTTAVVMGSRVFGGEWVALVEQLADFDIDLFVLCGDNREAQRRINGLRGKARLTTLGMVDRVQELIAAGDILITKAGGITTTEASHIGPCLLFANSIPGLEDRNEDFFIGLGAALRIDAKNGHRIFADLLAHPARIAQMRRNLLKIGRQNSALNIARRILNKGDRLLLNNP